VEFDTIKQLLAILFVMNFSEQPGFFKYSVDRSGDEPFLMAEYQNGTIWYVVGVLDKDVDLPDWKSVRNK
jgi:hypothetical protein